MKMEIFPYFQFIKYTQGANTYDVRFLSKQDVGQVASDFTKQAYVLMYVFGQVGRSKMPKNI